MTQTLFATVPIYSAGIILTGKDKGTLIPLSTDKVPIDQQATGVIRQRLTPDTDWLLVLSTVSQKEAIRKAVLAFQDHLSGKHIFKLGELYTITGED